MGCLVTVDMDGLVRAQLVMQPNFFGVEDAVNHFGVKLSDYNLAPLTSMPFSEEVLRACMHTHILTAVFPLSILDIRSKARECFYPQDWYDKRGFALEKGVKEIGWWLVRKQPISGSRNLPFDEQRDLLGNEVIPTPRILVYTAVGYLLATGEALLSAETMRTEVVVSNNCRVTFSQDNSTISLGKVLDSERHANLALSGSRRP